MATTLSPGIEVSKEGISSSEVEFSKGGISSSEVEFSKGEPSSSEIQYFKDRDAFGGTEYKIYDSIQSPEKEGSSYIQETPGIISERFEGEDSPIPNWSKCNHKRFDFFCDIYFAAITAVIFYPLRLTISTPYVQEMSLYEHLTRSFPGTNWPTILVNGIMLSVVFTYIVFVWFIQMKVIYLYLTVDRFVIWLNLCMMAFIAILPFVITSFELSLTSFEPAFLCICISIAGLCQCIHIIYAYIKNHYEMAYNEAHHNSNVIVLIIQLCSAIGIPVRLVFGYALWFVPIIGGDLLLIGYIMCIFAPFDHFLVERIFILIHKNTDEIDLIASFLKHFNKQLSKERLIQFCDVIFVVLVVIIIIDVLTIIISDVYIFNVVSNGTENIQSQDLLSFDRNFLYSWVWGLIVIFTLWFASYNMFSYISSIDRLILFMKMFSLYFTCLIPLFALALAEYSQGDNVGDLRLAILIALSTVTCIGIVQFILWVYIRFWSHNLHITAGILGITMFNRENVGTTNAPEISNPSETREIQNIRLNNVTTLKVFFLISTVPFISFILLLAELINMYSVNVFVIFIVFLLTVPFILFVEVIPSLTHYVIRFRRHVMQPPQEEMKKL